MVRAFYGHITLEEKIVIEYSVLQHFQKHAQSRLWKREAGGQLFARFEQDFVHIVFATGPYRSDKRSRHSFKPDKSMALNDINKMFRNGYHYVGDWHTHSEIDPYPSKQDIMCMQECFTKSSHSLGSFVLVIVGSMPSAEMLWVSLHNQSETLRLNLL